MKGSFASLLLFSLLLFSPSSLALSSEAKTAHLLHCLGHSASSRGDRTKIQAFFDSNPDPHDENAWLSLSPNTWGFKSHTLPGSDTWIPADGWAQTAKDRLDRQHKKLMMCADKVMKEADQPTTPAPAPDKGVVARPFGQPQTAPRQPGSDNTKVMPGIMDVNDAQDIRPGSDDDGKNQQKPADATAGSTPGTDNLKLAAAAADSQTPPAGQGTPPPGSPPASNPPGSGQNQPPGTPPVTDPPSTGQKTSPAAPDPATSSKKTAPGLGPDVQSVAPSLENDPNGKFLPKTQDLSINADHSSGATDLSALKIGGFSQDATKDALAVAFEAQNKTYPASNKGASPLFGQSKLATSSNGFNQFPDSETTNPGCEEIRIRKEYSSMTKEEKKAFADAMKCVRQKPSRFRTDPGWNQADDWTLLHIRMVKYVHFTAYFTVFHRGFTALVERDLNDCGFPLGLPWVDWTKTSDDPSTNALFDADPEYGLGTDGKGGKEDCPWATGLAVTDGALADHFFNAPFRHRLCRQFNNMNIKDPNPHFGPNCTTFINSNFIRGLGATHNRGRFFDFSSALEISSHLAMHTCIGGNLAWLTSSPNDSAFHLHHGLIDNIYDTWQKKDEKNKYAFHGPKQQENYGQHPPWTARREDVINFQPMADNVRVQDLLDPESGAWGGRMCYRYDYNVEM